VFGTSVAGIRKRVGIFDDRNGAFLEDNGGNLNVVLRSSVTGAPVDQPITQSMWNIDKLDGTGPSGLTIDMTKAQLLCVDLQWLGVGRARTGFDLGTGGTVYFHQFVGANVSSSVYMSNPNLPARYEVANVSSSASGTLEQICSSIISEGGYDSKNLFFTADRGITPITGIGSAALYPLVSIRLKTGSTGTLIIPKKASVLNTTGANAFRWAIVFNPQVGPIDNASWKPVLSSSVEFDTTRNTTNALTGGIVFITGYGTSTGGNTGIIDIPDFESALPLGADVDGTTDQLVLAAQTFASTDSFVGTLTWKEFS
jgi:hypothetical protein